MCLLVCAVKLYSPCICLWHFKVCIVTWVSVGHMRWTEPDTRNINYHRIYWSKYKIQVFFFCFCQIHNCSVTVSQSLFSAYTEHSVPVFNNFPKTCYFRAHNNCCCWHLTHRWNTQTEVCSQIYVTRGYCIMSSSENSSVFLDNS